MGTRKEDVEMKVKEVEDKEVELCVAHLRFLSKFYITIIEVSCLSCLLHILTSQ